MNLSNPYRSPKHVPQRGQSMKLAVYTVMILFAITFFVLTSLLIIALVRGLS